MIAESPTEKHADFLFVSTPNDLIFPSFHLKKKNFPFRSIRETNNFLFLFTLYGVCVFFLGVSLHNHSPNTPPCPFIRIFILFLFFICWVHFGCRETKLDEKKKKDQSVLGSRPGVGLNQRTGLIVNQKTPKLRRKLSPPKSFDSFHAKVRRPTPIVDAIPH